MDPYFLLGFAGAIPLVLLGAVLLLIRPRRPPQVFFALFAIAWGLQLAFMNGGYLLNDPRGVRLGLMLGSAVQPVATLLLVHFAMVVRRRPGYGYVTAIAALVAAAASLALVLRPGLVLAGTDPTDWGALNFPLFTVPQRIAFFLALLVMYTEYRRAKSGTPRRRYRGMVIAFALIVGWSNTHFLLATLAQPGEYIEFASGAVITPGGFSDLLLTTLLIILTLALIGVVLHLILRPPAPEGVDSTLVFAFVFPIATKLVEFITGYLGIPFETRGFWQILAVGVIVYTIANYQLFGFEMRIKRHAGPIAAGVLVLFGIPTTLTLALGEFGLQAFSYAVIPQVIGVAGIVVFQDRVRKAFFPGVEDTPDYVHQRKLDIYRVALEAALQHGGSVDDPGLKELRRRHAITDQEHSIIAWMVSSEYRQDTRGDPNGDEQRWDVGDTVLDRYQLQRLIGEGTYGKTLLAYDTRNRTEVALKTVDMETFDGAAARLLLREARLAATLDHPNVIDILDVAELPDRVVVVMEYADNGNLEDRLHEHGRFDLTQAVRFLRELLMALEAVHKKGIVHRNMKPKNILLEADGSVRLSDFGAAQSRRGKTTQTTRIASQTLHALLYQSPEQIEGKPSTPQSDLFVAGILFHEVLTRRHPFPIAGKDDHRIRTAILKGDLELHVANQPPWVKRLLTSALAREPEKRYASAPAMLRDLEQWAGLSDATRAEQPQDVPETMTSGAPSPPSAP